MTTDRPRAGPAVGARRFERLLETIVGVFGLLFSLQTVDSFIAGQASLALVPGAVLSLLIMLSVIVGLSAAVVRDRARELFLTAFLLYVAAIVVWPFAITGPVPTSPMPWPVAMSPVAVAYLVTACRHWLVPFVAQVLIGSGLAAVLLLVGGAPQADAVINGTFTMAVATVLIVLLGGVRRGVATADAAQQTALARYADTRLDDAIESERIRTDALVHDSVLMTLLAAAGARDAHSEALAERNARNAIRVLAAHVDAAAYGPRIPLAQTLASVEQELAQLVEHVDLRIKDAWDLMLPMGAAEAMVGAMLQAMVNSVRHAGPHAVRTARMAPYGVDGLRIVVEDDGRGFDPAAVSAERLGVRVSIVERVERVDGTATIDSGPGRGTRVVLTFGTPLEDDDEDAVVDRVPVTV